MLKRVLRALVFISLLFLALVRVVYPASLETVFDSLPRAPFVAVEGPHHGGAGQAYSTHSTPTPDDGVGAPDDEHADDELLVVPRLVEMRTCPVRGTRVLFERAVAAREAQDRLDRPPRV